MKGRYWFVAAVIFSVVAIFGLRSNSLQVAELKQQIEAQDQAGADVSGVVEELRQFVFSHMNSSARFVLSGSYQRALASAQAAGVTGELYAQAQATCDRQGVSSVAQAQCVQSFLSQHLGQTSTIELPLLNQYSYAFAAPAWSPDLAGLSLMTAVVCTFAAVFFYLRRLFQNRSSSI